MNDVKDLIIVIEEFLDVDIVEVQPVSGGDINKALHLKTISGEYFLKYNTGNRAKNMLSSEKSGLQLLYQATAIGVVEPIEIFFTGEITGLLLPFIRSSTPNRSFWHSFGHQLSQLHRTSREFFGLDYDNFIGSIPQDNTPETSWSEFYTTRRIVPLIKAVFDQGLLGKREVRSSEKFCHKIQDIFPSESSALLHGDLWSGNFLCNEDGLPVLIDPAPYFGHREMDIAMTALFGGFDPVFYASYEASFPLTPKWQNRIKYGQLYYLLVHLDLFGIAYKRQVTAILHEFD